MTASVTKEPNTGTASAEGQDTDCEKVVGVFEKWLKGNATNEDEEYLSAHADACSPCFENIDKQQKFVEFLNNALRKPGTPASLVDTIKSKIHQTA